MLQYDGNSSEAAMWIYCEEELGHELSDAGNGNVQCHQCKHLWPNLEAIPKRTCVEMKENL